MPTAHLIVKGKVQGVFFRASAKEIAQALDLKGWVKNTAEGNVEAMVSGDEDSVQQFIEWCRQGPQHAVVNSLHVKSVTEKSFPDFRILRG